MHMRGRSRGGLGALVKLEHLRPHELRVRGPGHRRRLEIRANDDALKQIMRRVFEEIKPFVTRHEPDVPEEDLPELSRTRDLSMADFTVQCSRFFAKRKVNPAEYVKNLSETIQRQIKEDGNRDGFIKSVQAVGPYMNIFVKRQKVFKLAINAIIEQGTKYGLSLIHI